MCGYLRRNDKSTLLLVIMSSNGILHLKMEDLYYRWWVLNNPSMGGGEPDGTSTVVTEIKPKYSMKPVVHDQFKLQGYVHYTNIDSVGRGVAVYIEDLE